MQAREIALAVCEFGDYFAMKFWQNTVPCPCTAATGDYSADWHRDNPSAVNCGGLGIVGGTSSILTRLAIWQPVFLAGRTIRDFIDVTHVGEFKETDIIVFAATSASGDSVSWSMYTRVEATFFDKTYRLLRVIPVPWGEMAIFRQVT